MITEIKACDSLEKKHIKEAISWILSGENLFRIKKDAIPPKHLVSYCVVVDFKNKSVLLVDHKKSKLLLPTGGHVDVNEMPLQAAKRELQEELDLTLEPISFNKEIEIPSFITITDTVGISEKHTDVSLWYLFKGSLDDDIPERSLESQKEFATHQWFTLDKILETPIEKFDMHMHRFTNKLNQIIDKNY